MQKRNGVGLQNICSRTELFNGTVQITAAPAKGCQLTVQFNIQAQLTQLQADIRA